MKRLIFAFFVAAALISSPVDAKKISWDNARKIQVGMTTEQVTKLMGKPTSVSVTSDGRVRYIWVHVGMFTLATQSLYIDFIDGKAAAVPVIPDEFGK
jgi:hypothetical protein